MAKGDNQAIYQEGYQLYVREKTIYNLKKQDI
jgi:hypothetical protein